MVMNQVASVDRRLRIVNRNKIKARSRAEVSTTISEAPKIVDVLNTFASRNNAAASSADRKMSVAP